MNKSPVFKASSPNHDVEIYIQTGVKVTIREDKISYQSLSPVFAKVPNNTPADSVRYLEVNKVSSDTEEEKEDVQCCSCFRFRK